MRDLWLDFLLDFELIAGKFSDFFLIDLVYFNLTRTLLDLLYGLSLLSAGLFLLSIFVSLRDLL